MKTNISVSLPLDLIDYLKSEAKKKHTTVSAIIQQLLYARMENSNEQTTKNM